jgi:hypothetical protein
MLGRAATKIELNRDNDLEELVEARKLFEKKKIQVKPTSHQLLAFQQQQPPKNIHTFSN